MVWEQPATLRSCVICHTVARLTRAGKVFPKRKSPQQSDKLGVFRNIFRAFLNSYPPQFVPWIVPTGAIPFSLKTTGDSMQNGSSIRAERQQGPDVWEFRWREPGPDGKRKHRRMVVGSVNNFVDAVAARQAVAGLRLDMNRRDERVKAKSITISELADHYRQRELKPDTLWKTHSTKVTYEGYLNKWILQRWGRYPLARINAGEVELWLRSLTLARSSCAKIRNIMSVIFNHGIRHGICDRNPIRLVRQSAKRRTFPVVLDASQVRRLIAALALRELPLWSLLSGLVCGRANCSL